MAEPSTTSIVSVTDIRDNVVFTGHGSLRMIVEVSAINFELRSSDEQTAILQGFQQFLNSIDFPLQIVVNSRRYDIEKYLARVDEATESLTNTLLKVQAVEYGKFVGELSKLSNIMAKRFFIVIPFFAFETPGGGGILNSIKSVFKRTETSAGLSDEQFTTYRGQLLQRAELVFSGLAGLGLRVRILEEQELLDLFRSLYNPDVESRSSPIKTP